MENKSNKSDSTSSTPTISDHPVISGKSAAKNIANKKKECSLKFGTWNVRRGLIKREIEITQMLLDEELDVLFITETGTKIENEKDFQVAVYKTIFHIREENTQKVRMMCFIICVIALCTLILSHTYILYEFYTPYCL